MTALKTRLVPGYQGTFPVGATEIPKGSCVKLSSSLLIVTTGNEDGIGVTDEIGYVGKDCRVNIPGPIIEALAHDSSITENQRVVPAASGRVDGIGTLTGGVTYSCGIALMASSAQDQLISIILVWTVLPKAAA